MAVSSANVAIVTFGWTGISAVYRTNREEETPPCGTPAWTGWEREVVAVIQVYMLGRFVHTHSATLQH